MKTIRYIDVAIQAGLFAWAIATVVEILAGRNTGAILLVQFFVGAYQMTSCFFSILFSPSSPPRGKVIHFITAIIYLAILSGVSGSLTVFWRDMLLFAPAWLLAVYYFVISIRFLKVRQGRRSKFLPNLGF